MKLFYKIVEPGENGAIKTLFHGINGNKILPIGVWIDAEIKTNVIDGKGSSYTSGIHVIDGLEEAKKYLKRFVRKDRVIIHCYADDVTKKNKSKHKVYLAKRIFIPLKKFPK